MNVLVLNVGSSTLKAQLRSEPDRRAPAWGVSTEMKPGAVSRALESVSKSSIDVVGHRVVHGGASLRQTTRITPEVKAEIARLAEFAPEHNGPQAEAIDVVERMLGSKIPQFAVFDTAFHSTLPEFAATYPGPYSWLQQGIRRYGFHGISHRYVSRRAAEILDRPIEDLRIVSCHLGSGCSLAAVLGGRSIDTTMGFTPLAGLMMGSRSGDVDPGILIYLLRRGNCTADQLDRLLNHGSGLKGLSGVSDDMRKVMSAAQAGDARAKLALDVYIHRLCREIGGMSASLNGMDVLIFTAGVGENSAEVRRRACEKLSFLGVKLDTAKNASEPVDVNVASGDSAVSVLVIHTEEESEIARDCYYANGGD